MTIRRISLAAGLGLVLAAACNQEELLRPPVPGYARGAMFQRYVAFGNSITAGFQGFGLNDSIQRLAYPVVMANAMGLITATDTNFFYPSLTNPGCPPPITFIFSNPPQRVGGLPETFCALRSPNIPPFLNNVAFPGADVLEAFTYSPPQPPPSPTDVYKLFLLGGRTEIERAREIKPTFVTVWLGNNDVLGAILDIPDAGNPALVTPPATFASRFQAFMDSIDSFGTIQGGVLIGAVQVTGAPYVSQGRAYARAALFIPTLLVDSNCVVSAPIPGGGPGDSAFVFVPFHYGAPLVAQAAGGMPTTLDCSVPQVISVSEAINMITSVALYNQTIAQEAAQRKWRFLDPNPLLKVLAADTNLVRPFPHFPPNPTAPDSISVNAPFGSVLSRDGVHPSSATQKLLAKILVDSINAHYQSAIPSITLP